MWMPSICTTMMSSADRSAPIHCFMRAADNATKCREAADFNTPAPRWCGNIALGKPHRSAEFPRRDVGSRSCPGFGPSDDRAGHRCGHGEPASLLGVRFHHGPERLDPGRQAEPIKADRNGVPSFVHSPHSSRRRSDRCCANFLHGVAFLRGFDTPSPPAQGEQRRPSYFNIRRGNPT
jgi:hypothetical protein